MSEYKNELDRFTKKLSELCTEFSIDLQGVNFDSKSLPEAFSLCSQINCEDHEECYITFENGKLVAKCRPK